MKESKTMPNEALRGKIGADLNDTDLEMALQEAESLREMCPADVLILAAEVRRLRAENEQLRTELNNWKLDSVARCFP